MPQGNTDVQVTGAFGDYTIKVKCPDGATFSWPAVVHMFPSPMTDVAAVIQRIIDDVRAYDAKPKG
jgi:hypothetical protein